MDYLISLRSMKLSSFTQFNGELCIRFDHSASKALGKDYWRVHDSFRYYIGSVYSDFYVDVKAGKLTDGASIPFPFRGLLQVWSDYGQAIVVHDLLCDTYEATKLVNGVETKVKMSRVEIDDILIEAMGILKVPEWKRDLMEIGLTLYRLFFNPKGPKPSDKKMALEAEYVAVE